MNVLFLFIVDSILILLFFAACCYRKSSPIPILNDDNYIKYDIDEEYILDIVPDNEEVYN